MTEKREILEQLSSGEITPQQAEEQLNNLRLSKKESFKSFCTDLCLNFGGDHNRIILEEVHTGVLSQGPAVLDLAAANGSIHVETWDSPDYCLTVKKRVKASSREEAEEIASKYSFTEINGNIIQAGEPQCKQNRKVSVSLHLQLPLGHGIEGKIKTANGSITVSRIENQNLDLSSANGSIRLEEIKGGPIKVKTVNGSIKILGEARAVDAGTTNGSITLDSKLSGDTELRTVNGSIRVELPASPDTGIALIASTTCGRVSLDHSQFVNRKVGGPGGKYIETHSSNWDHAGKNIKLELSTVNGSIKIRES